MTDRMTDRITDSYTTENRILHEKAGYGSSGHLWLGHVVEIAQAVNARSLIDYGAGKGTLGPYLEPFGIKYIPYDPATFPEVPKEPADMLVCLDVLEHIEPRSLATVLEHMHSLTRKVVFANVCTRASSKTLMDGRNAHLIVKDWQWWKQHLHRGTTYRMIRLRQHAETFDFVGKPIGPGKEPLSPDQIKRLKG